MRFRFLLFSFLLFASIQCKDSILYPCEDIRKGLLDYNVEQVKPAIDKMLEDLVPIPNTDDQIGHSENLSEFVQRLNTDCDIESSIGCYGCIETFPVLSHIDIVLDSAGLSITRTLDIVTPSDTVMTLRNIHQ